ncbi:D-isomer specific 2-hydroxyacid dehydrogenase family protein [Pectinatus frisingensis]|uniref:D-isomer specific 2-hydroxyacid dehydrogenase family protein n=1 Tax=Pectinatus frisingensis TaxID=865 RepID=UPI0018C4880D|nr:D-isomer specific 2-hydroxyacid dehydrogenase family protein [Pectinatus frisingensis]
MNVKIAVVNSSSFGKIFPEHVAELQNMGQVDRFEVPKDLGGKKLAEKLMGYSIIIASVTALYNKEFFEYKDKTLLIARHGIGYNNIDIEAATEKGTIVTKVSAPVEQESVAENAVALLMNIMRLVQPASLKVRQGKWSERASFIGNELKNKTIGIIGFGNIGSRVGHILKNGFDADIMVYDPYLCENDITQYGLKVASLEELLKKADAISINACVTEDNYHLLDKKEFSMMKKGIYIVNTARGQLINEAALIEALNNKIVAGAGLDVMENEPIDAEHPLLGYDNVIITPHTSAYTYECLNGMGIKVVTDVKRVLSGRMPDEVINKKIFDK